MMSMLTQIFVRRYAHHHALLIVFLSSAIWGVLWAPMRFAESSGISGLWVVTLFHVLPAIAILPFIARPISLTGNIGRCHSSLAG
jgi:hypothetical protein